MKTIQYEGSAERVAQNTLITPSEVVLELLSCLKIQSNFRHCFLLLICHPLDQGTFSEQTI